MKEDTKQKINAPACEDDAHPPSKETAILIRTRTEPGSNVNPRRSLPRRGLTRRVTSVERVRPARRNLSALSSIRVFATLWILLGHFQQRGLNGDEFMEKILNRGFIPVSVYIVLSGFVTHYAYRQKKYTCVRDYAHFYVRRMTRVLFSYYASCILGLLDPLYTKHDALASDYPVHATATIFLIQSWFFLPDTTEWSRDLPREPNPAGWTISTLVFAWLFYPMLNNMMKAFRKWTNDSWKPLVILFMVAYLIDFLPALITYFVQDKEISNSLFEFFYKFPVLRLSTFFLGLVTAEFVDRPAVQEWAGWRFLPDLLILLVGLVSGLYPDNEDGRANSETLLITILDGPISIILLGISCSSAQIHDGKMKGPITQILGHKVLINIGSWTFPIYVFQYTFFYDFHALQDLNSGDVSHKLIAAYLMPYLLFLFLFSAMWTGRLEKPFAQWAKRLSDKYLGRKKDTSPQQRANARLSFKLKQIAEGGVSVELLEVQPNNTNGHEGPDGNDFVTLARTTISNTSTSYLNGNIQLADDECDASSLEDDESESEDFDESELHPEVVNTNLNFRESVSGLHIT